MIANGEESDVKAADVRSAEAMQVIKDSGFEGLVLTDGYLWDFKTCPPISSYIYCLCAGEYVKIDNTDPDAPTPMRIFARQSKVE